jgi:pimeloyl-ACP methyl ester carboxylesterase
MPGTKRLVRHLILVVLALLPDSIGSRTIHAQDAGFTSNFVVTFGGARIGAERVTVSRPGGAFKITMIGQIGPPFDLVTTRFELTYSADWQPQQLVMEGAAKNETLNISTSFGVTTATNEIVQGQKRGGVSHQVSPRTIVIPVNFFAAYEAMAARLVGLQAGARIPVYIAPEGEITATVNKVTPRRITSPAGTADLQEYDLTLARPGLPMAVQVMVDRSGRLARVVYSDVALSAVREEFATVMAREVRVTRDGDEQLYIPASGFNIGATLSRPRTTTGRLPAVILVGGPGRQDRDETLYGVPVFGYLAGALADAGYLVVRYDKRGVGQSGGRTEHAGLEEYADDVVAIAAWLRKRKDVDPDRISVLTHGDGSAVGLIAVGKDKKVRALGLLAAPGLTGREVVLEQQRQALARRNEPEADRQAKIALQKRVIDVVTTGKGWETLPPDVRRQADSPWFKSWLLFDPAVAVKKVSQPMLILHGAVDQQTPPSQGDLLAQLSAGRKGATAADTHKVVVPGVNHLMVVGPGDPDSFDSLPAEEIAPDVVRAIVAWLNAPVK